MLDFLEWTQGCNVLPLCEHKIGFCEHERKYREIAANPEKDAYVPEKDAYVFPQIFHGNEDEIVRRKLTVQENSNIKDRVIRICKEVLGWDKKPSGTWARHSFATNLKHLGVEELYISESMGHSLGNNITAGYQDMYPLETRFEYNSKLLNLEEEKLDIDVDSMTPEQMKEMLKKVLGQKIINPR